MASETIDGRHVVFTRDEILESGGFAEPLIASGVRFKLPEANPFAAVAELVALDESENLLSRAVSVVDLRLEDRITVHPPPNAGPGGGQTPKTAPMPQAGLGART